MNPLAPPTARRAFAVALTARLVLAIVTAGLAVVAAGLLNRGELGRWFLALAIVNLSAAVSVAGVNHVVVGRLASGAFDASSVIRSAGSLTTRSLVTVIAAFVTPISAVMVVTGVSDWSWSLMAATLVLVPLQALQALAAEIARGLDAIALAGLLSGAGSRTMTIIGFGALSATDLNASAETLVMIEVAMVGLVGLTCAPALARRVRRRMLGRHSPSGTFGAGHTKWLAVQDLATQVVAQGDLIIAGLVLTAAELADYGVGLRLIALVALPLQVLGRALSPTIARAVTVDDARSMRPMIRRLVVAVAAASASIVAAYVVLGRPIIRLMFGTEYEGAWVVLVVLALGQIVNVVTGPCAYVLIHAGEDRRIATYAITAATIVVIGCAVGGTLGGGPGVAAAAALAAAVQNLLSWNAARTRIGLRTDPFPG